MIVSHKWLQTYFEKDLPEADKLEELITLRAFEVEDINKVGDDHVLDIDVLPNRAHDCLSHRGIAKELAVLLKLDIKYPEREVAVAEKTESVSVKNEEQDVCRRYVGRKIEGVKVCPSPDWLRERLETIGQKSINNIVDATNYVMFDVGQPLHAFDADKVDGGIVVRYAKNGEKITTLSGDEVELDESVLVIADEKEPLAIAGVKGGKKAEVDEDTTNIILEAANFDPVNVRKTSRKLNILTDSSKRFENEITPELEGQGMEEVSSLVVKVAGGKDTKISDISDVYPRKAKPYKVGVSVNEINNLLGVGLPKDEVRGIWNRFGFEYEEVNPVDKVVNNSAGFEGVPYKYGASVTYDAPEAFDCSSFTSFLFAQSGVQIPRMAVDQYVFGKYVNESEIKPGDVVFSNTEEGKIFYESKEWMTGTKVPEGVDHCGIFLGDNKIVHATRYKGSVIIENLKESEQFKNIVGVRRMTEEKERFVVTIPSQRMDLRIKEDLIEEVGRVYGYGNIESQPLEKDMDALINKTFYYVNKIRSILVREGFSEVYTYSFTDSGEVEVENPMAEDKRFLRSGLANSIKGSVENNFRYADLLGVDKIKIFEIGKVFKSKKEELRLCIAVRHTKSKKGESADLDMEEVLKTLSSELGVSVDGEVKEGLFELDLEKLVGQLPEPPSYEDTLETYIDEVKYKTISPYPFVGRDIAVFVPEGVEEEEIKEIIESQAGELLVRDPKLFDRFEKKDKETGKIEKVSYAFNMVFQSYEKTLTDEEVNEIMEKITKMLNNKEGWGVR